MGSTATWKQLDIAVIGGGIGGQASAVSLRRQGHKVTIYERADFAGEVGASISCAANGTRWLEEWDVDIAMGDPVLLKSLISRDWVTGNPINVYDLSNYKEEWGYVSFLSMTRKFHFHPLYTRTNYSNAELLHVSSPVHACHAQSQRHGPKGSRYPS